MRFIYLICLGLFISTCSSEDFPIRYEYAGDVINEGVTFVVSDDLSWRIVETDNEEVAEFIDFYVDLIQDDDNPFEEMVVTLEDEGNATIMINDPTEGIQSFTFMYQFLENPDRIAFDDGTIFTNWIIDGDCYSIPSFGWLNRFFFNDEERVLLNLYTDEDGSILSTEDYLENLISSERIVAGDTITIVDVNFRFCPQ